jgi:hypothetical protein
MIFVKPYSSLILIAILILVISTSLLFGFISPGCNNSKEGFDLYPLVTDPSTKKISNGYYQIDESNMAILPYGYKIDPLDPKKIIPFTKKAKYQSQTIVIEDPNKEYPLVPKPGEKMPDGVYLISDSSLANLPPNMMPNVSRIDFTTTDPPKLQYYYTTGYTSETQYYNNKFKPTNNTSSSLPKGVYYTDSTKTFVSFLKYGQIADQSKGFGVIADPNKNMSTTDFNYTTSNYRDISSNFDVEFHDNAASIIEKNKMYDLGYDQIRVKDQNGNIVILPKTNSQGSITYYSPGEFTFGASKYVPNYEDSVYLSSIGYRTKFGNTNAKSSGCDSMCQAFKEFKLKIEQTCNS